MSRKSVIWGLVLSSVLVCTSAVVVAIGRSHFSYDLLADRDTRARGQPGLIHEWLARLGEKVLPLLDPGDTEFAPGFSPEAFEKVAIGMSQQEVLATLGEPLLKKRFPDGTTVWYYSRHGAHSKNFFVRALELDGDGRVARKFREYYVD